MAYSCKLDIRRDAPKKDGTASLFLQVIIDRQKTTVALNLNWPVTFFNQKTDTIEPISRSKADQQTYHDYTLIINAERNKVNEIFTWYRLADRVLTIDMFKSELVNFANRHDFLEFWSRTIEDEYAAGILKNGSYRSLKSSLTNLRTFRPDITFSSLDTTLVANWKAYMINKLQYDINTVWCRLKHFRTIVNRAKKQGMVFDFKPTDFAMPKTHRRIIYLDEEEFARLLAYFNSEVIEEKYPGQKRSLRAFLFACYTGMRVSDIQQVKWSNVDGDFLEFTPIKTAGLVATLRIPLSQKAQDLIITKKGVLLDCPSAQKMNEHLKEIALMCTIKKNITMHVGRHTFATRLLSRGGKLERLKELLGHVNIKSTMIYVHVSEDDMKHDVNLL